MSLSYVSPFEWHRLRFPPASSEFLKASAGLRIRSCKCNKFRVSHQAMKRRLLVFLASCQISGSRPLAKCEAFINEEQMPCLQRQMQVQAEVA